MSDRAFVTITSGKGWRYGETTWDDDRTRPADGWRPRGVGDARVVPFRSVVDALDFARFEGIYRRSNGEWTAYLACWLAIEHLLGETVPDPRGDGAVIAIRSSRDATALRTWFRATKGTIADAVRAGQLSGACARRRLLDGLQRRSRDREVIVGSKYANDR